MSVRVAINGFGRIGRIFFRASLDHPGFEVVAVNDLTDARTLTHLLKYDSVHGILPGDIKAGENSIQINGRTIQVLGEKDPSSLPWKDLGVDIVVESTGFFTGHAAASQHLKAGARKVVVSAPSKDPDLTVVMGVNQDQYDPGKHSIISNASCTTNCLAPVAKVLLDSFGINRGLMTTVHSVTNDQRLLDLPHKDLRRARAAGISMIPTTTGAAKALALVLPQLKGKVDGMSIRVPTPNVSVIDFVAELGKDTTEDEVKSRFSQAADGPMKGILEYTDEPLVSIDLNENPHSAIFDSSLTKVMEGRMVKVIAWYDNEWGYSCRVRDLVQFIADKL